MFECNVCLEGPKDPVLTQCGHIYCHSCISHWLRQHEDSAECPVCKFPVYGHSVIRIYGAARSETEPTERISADEEKASLEDQQAHIDKQQAIIDEQQARIDEQQARMEEQQSHLGLLALLHLRLV